MRDPIRVLSASVSVTVIVIATVLAAAKDAYAADSATAQALFDQARKLMTEKRWSEACPKLEESQRLDPGGGTLLHLGLCREHEGRTASAWTAYQEALAQATRDGRKDRAKIAQTKIDALAPHLARIRLKVASTNRALSGFRLTRDEMLVSESQWGESFPVDPGHHVFVARAEGRRAWTAKVTARAGSETSIEVPELDVDPKSEVEASKLDSKEVLTPPPATPRKQEGPPIETGTRGDTQRTVGLVVSGVGIAGLVVGTIYGFVSLARRDDADAECRAPDYKLCSAKGVETGHDAITAGNVSTIAFVAGGILVAGGAVLYLTAPRAGSTVGIATAANAHGGSLELRGTF